MQVTYLFDPLCGWCYGASPALDRIAGIPGVKLELAPTGLFSGQNARLMDTQFGAFAWQNDRRIARLTGQAFSDAYKEKVLGAPGSSFDSAPATLALVAVGLSAPDKERQTLKALQAARYVDGRNTSDIATVTEVLREQGLSAAADRLVSPDAALLATYADRTDAARRVMRQFGLNGVPAVIIERGGLRRPLDSGALFGGIELLIQEVAAA